jgi:histone H3/H4
MTMADPSDGDELADALARARTRVNRVTEHQPFSDQAYAALNEYISEYIRALTLESTSVARRQSSDVVSAKDVDRASGYLFSGSTRRGFTQYLGTVGGVLFGAALGNALNLLSVDHPSAPSIIVTAALAVMGAVLISFNVARDFR